jgi:hypothetical protein
MHYFAIYFSKGIKENNNSNNKNTCTMLSGPLVLMDWRVLGREERRSSDSPM